MEVLSEAPRTSAFVPLSEHQSTTPASFVNGPAVLHYYSDRCQLVCVVSEVNSAPALANLLRKASAANATQQTTSENGREVQHVNGSAATEALPEHTEKTIAEIEVWVTSDKLLIYSSPAQTGVSIPYPSISLHAIQSLPHPTPNDTSSQGLYMQIMNTSQTGNSSNEDDEDLDSISITIIPTASAAPVPAGASAADDADDAVETENLPEVTPVQAMFAALSECSNLHPDPVEEGDEDGMAGSGPAMAFEDGVEGSEFYRAGLLQAGVNDGSGGLPPPLPGSGGWITAENMHEYFDESGEWIGPASTAVNGAGDEDDDEMDGSPVANGSAPLGPGAGHVRRAEEGQDEDGTKWRRTG